MYRYLILFMALLLCGCSQTKETAWIVLDISLPDGEPVQLAFDNPEEPDMSLKACNTHLENNRPIIMKYVQEELNYQGADYVNAKCVMSAGDPLKPEPR